MPANFVVNRSTALHTDSDADGKADPGDVLRTTVTLHNTGDSDATGASYSDLLGGSTLTGVVNVSPIAFNDSFTAVGNTVLRVGGAANIGSGPSSQVAGNLLTNDTNASGDGVTGFHLDAVANGTSAQGGTFNINSDGTFNYESAAGFTGTDSFTYTIHDNGLDGVDGTGDELTSTATVSINVTGQVWYVDSSAAAGGDGTSSNPFSSVTELNTANVDGANDYVYVMGSAAGNVSMEQGEHLIGQGADLTVGGFTLATAGLNNSTLTGSSTATVVLAGASSNNEIAGIDVKGVSGITGSSFGTLTVSHSAIDVSGQALSLTTGTVAGTGFTSTDSDSGTDNVALTGIGGTVNLGSGALSGASGNAVLISGGAANVDYNGTITHTANAVAVNVTGHTGGTVQFDGAIASNTSSDGISLTNNTGATINFTGGLAVNTTASSGSVGFNATGGGTVNVTGTNTLSSAGGAALNVSGDTIGSSGLTFQSISANGGANGIVLSSTGSSGGLSITGTGSASSGGTIQNTSGSGISLTNTQNVSFNDINVHDTGQNGIGGFGVTNFSLTNSTLTNNGTAVAGQYLENAIAFAESSGFTDYVLSGAVTITGNTITQPHRNAIMIETWSGTISNLNISNNTLSGGTTTADIGDAIHVFSQGSASTTGNITTGTINNNSISNFEFLSSGIQIGGNGIRVAGGSGNASNNTTATLGTAANPIEISGNDVDNVGSNAIAVSFNGQQGISNFNIHGNGTAADAMTNMEGLGISVFFGGSGTFGATVDNNFVDNNGPTVNAGSAGIGVQLDDGPSGTGTATGVASIHVTNNTITNPDGFGIRGIVRASDGTLNLWVQNNNVGTPSASNREAIRIDSGSSIGDTTLNLNISGNSGPLASTTDNLVGSGLDAGIGVRKQGTVQSVNEFNIQGVVDNPTNTQVQSYIGSLNHTADGTGGSFAGVDLISGSGYDTTSAVPLLAAGVPTSLPDTTMPSDPTGTTGTDGGTNTTTPDPTPPTGSDGTETGPTIVDDGVLSAGELQLVVDAAIARWAAAGASEAQLAAMRATTFSVGDLAGQEVGEATAGHVTIDANAAGFSWFVDGTPGDDSEFSGSGSDLHAADPLSAAGTRIDLLTTVMHELGHQVGLVDEYSSSDAADLMYAVIDPGERRLPSAGDVAGATGAPVTETAFALSPVSIGTIPAGQTVTLQWDSIVNAYTGNTVVPTYNNTGTVSGSNFGDTTSNTETLSSASAPVALDTLTLGDLVFNDANFNGALDSGESGIVGVHLTLYADDGTTAGQWDASDTQLATTVTDGTGHYSFGSLAQGDYIVGVDAANFGSGQPLETTHATLPGAGDPDDDVDSDSNGVAGGGMVVSQPITLGLDSEPGGTSTNTTVDFGFFATVFTGTPGPDTFTAPTNDPWTISGAGSNDTLTGGASWDRINGEAGDDTLNGAQGADVLNGGIGNDTMNGGNGDDIYYVDSAGDAVVELPGGGTDLIRTSIGGLVLADNVENLKLLGSATSANGNGLDNALAGGNGGDTLHGAGGADTLNGLGGADFLYGDAGTDALFGGSDNDWLYGGDDNDTLSGDAGTDRLYGEAGNDTLDGGAGYDRIDGGAGQDTLTGGGDNDRFFFAAGDTSAVRANADHITDFSQAEGDLIDLHSLDAVHNQTGNQAFTFIDTAAFDGTAGELRYEQSGGVTYVEGDTNGDSLADFSIALDGTHTLVAADFVL